MPTTRFILPKLNPRNVDCAESIIEERVRLNDASAIQNSDVIKRNTNTKWKLHKGLLYSGILLLVIGTVLLIFEPFGILIKLLVTFHEGSVSYQLWRYTPVNNNVIFYIFNYTNTEAFLRGEEKLRIEEIGPYVFEAGVVYKNLTFFENNTMKYLLTTRTTPVPEKSVNNYGEFITVPNLVFLGIASYIAEFSFVTNMGFNAVASYMGSEPFLTMTVEEFLMGYDEPLLDYARRLFPQAVPVGKIGYVALMNDDSSSVTTINTNLEPTVGTDGSIVQPLTLDTVDWSPGLPYYGYDEEDNSTHLPCNTLRGVATPIPRIPRSDYSTQPATYFNRPVCRLFPFTFTNHSKTTLGIPTLMYNLTRDAYNNSIPENKCYCDSYDGPCLPDGLTDVSPCTFNMPVALSRPHFLYGEPQLAAAYDSLRPDKDKHDSYCVLEPEIGYLVEFHMRIQMNLVMKNTKKNAKAAALKNMVLPIMWVDSAFTDMPLIYHLLLYVGVFIAPVTNKVVTAVTLLTSVIMFTIFTTRYFHTRRSLIRKQRGN